MPVVAQEPPRVRGTLGLQPWCLLCRLRLESALQALDVFFDAALDAVQLHGGMGMAEEMKISHAFRRLTLLPNQNGHVSSHLDRFIALAREQDAGRASAVPAGKRRATAGA